VIYLARHGETDWNRIGRYQGRMESQLSELGERQAAALAAFFEALPPELQPTRVISSPLGRCVATAEPAARALAVPIELDDRITEIDHGTWNGRMRDEIAANDPERYAEWRNAPADVAFDGGETLAQVEHRWRMFEGDLAERGGETLVVTHDAVMRVAILVAMRRPIGEFWNVNAENGAFAVLQPNKRRLHLVEESVTAHLGDARASIAKQAL
jgi:probable phosphoglycerate mutase